MNYLIEKWKNLDSQDEKISESLNTKKIKIEAFNKKLSFGTAGIRGKMEAGSNRINEYTIAAAAEAFSLFLLKNSISKKIKIIIANDNRINGDLYKEITSRVMQKHGIDTYILKNSQLMPTPLLSNLIKKMNMDGGVNITASHNPKEYNGFKIYNRFGSQFISENTNEISSIMSKIDLFNIELGDFNPIYIKKQLVDQYISEVSKLSKYKKYSVDVAYSPLHGTGTHIGPKLLKEIGVKYWVDKKQSVIDGNFSGTKSPNPEDVKAYDGVIKIAKKNKADIGIVTDPDSDRVGVVSKYKKRWKYISGNELAVLYADFLFTKLKNEGRLKKNAFIVKSLVSTNLIKMIAEKHSIKVIETHVGFKNIADKILETKGQFLFAFEESFGMLIDEKISLDKDAFQGVVAAVDIAENLKRQNSDMFSRLEEIHKEYGVVRNTQISKKLSSGQVTKLFKNLKKNKSLNGLTFESFIDYTKKNEIGIAKAYKVNLKDGSNFIIRPSGTEPKTKIYIENVAKKGQRQIDITYKEKIIENLINDNIEENDTDDKKWSWKIFWKYVLFLIIIIAIMVIIFKVVFEMNSTKDVWLNAKAVYKKIGGYKILISIISGIIVGTLGAWMRKRLIQFQGQKVKWRHLIISSYMGIIISYITPFAIGGDAIGYWYLRRKGFKRGPLLASFMTSTILYQISILVQSMIFLPVGMPIYEMVFQSGDIQSHAAFIMFLVNVSWDVFATFMIISLVVAKKYQEWIVRASTKLLEWLPFIRIQNYASASAEYQYELREMRMGMAKLWHHKWILLETFTYEMIPRIFMFSALINMWYGVVRDDAPLGPYWSQVISFDLASTANSMSITPGGSGTSEWLNMTINQHIYKPNFASPGSTGSDLAISMDVISKMANGWPLLLFSSLLILTIVVGEQRKTSYSKKKIKNKSSSNGKSITKTKTSFYWKVSIPWTILIVSWFSIVSFIW